MSIALAARRHRARRAPSSRSPRAVIALAARLALALGLAPPYTFGVETAFAAVLFRSSEVPDRALSHGFAVALAGFDAPDPHLSVTELRGLPGYAVAFYRSGARGRGSASLTLEEELEHAFELFEDELPPGLRVRDAAAELGATGARVYAIAYREALLHDDAWCFGPDGYVRRFARDGADGLEHGRETLDTAETDALELDVGEDATDEETRLAEERAAKPHRGSTFLANELGAPVLPALVGALFEGGRRIDVRLVDASPDAIADEVRKLHRVLGRVDGRRAFEPPAVVGGVATSRAYAAFASTYDFADPRDPDDLYRELSIGRITGTLRFLREAELSAVSTDASFAPAAARGLYPIARLRPSALGGRSAAEGAIVALAPDHETLELVAEGGASRPAGPTFGELLAYLALGWKTRSEVEEDLIDALMLRAQIVVSRER